MLYINKKVLASDARYFSNKNAINALMNSGNKVDLDKAGKEHDQILDALKKAGIEVIQIPSPDNCQDGVYVANWAFILNNKAFLSRLPNTRKVEEPYAKQILERFNLELVKMPSNVKAFSGQGDTLACGRYIFCQSPYRSSKEAHLELQKAFPDKIVVSLRTKPQRWFRIGPKKVNKITGWLDSPTYDLDLALAILKPPLNNQNCLIAYSPSRFTRKSKKKLNSLKDVDKIKVSKKETIKNYALNLVSTGEKVILNSGTTKFVEDLKKAGLKTIELDLPELKKGGGSIRCCTLTLE